MTPDAWTSTDVLNPPFSTSMQRSWNKQWIFLDSVDFRIHGIGFSHLDSACVAGAYTCEIESELRRLNQQNAAENDALMQRHFPTARYDRDRPDLDMDAARQLNLDTSSFEHCAVLWGPEPFDGFLSLLIRMSRHDVFIGPARGKHHGAGPHVFVLPSGAYQHHLKEVLSRLSVPATTPNTATQSGSN
ncbi:hypothetical protein CR152_16805 [Massilia violaceinigra]|uniref:Uncharacterized protein n=1 Tax=Massilia violaceinigra TaxID=2045208 RepID=A0A2D2DM25_9BURK|nr:hypothetical protein [Massilia violaceinigra]ATQ76010.1 hypothetical protein CR152_16805 [Massilia violaceinigra]